MTHRVSLISVMGQSRNPQTIGPGRSSAMATNCQFEGMQGKVLEAVAAFTQAHERGAGQLVELSSTPGPEGLRAMAALQTQAIATPRACPSPSAPTRDA